MVGNDIQDSTSLLLIWSKTNGSFVCEIRIQNSINIERIFSGIDDIVAVELKTNAPMNSLKVYSVSRYPIIFIEDVVNMGVIR